MYETAEDPARLQTLIGQRVAKAGSTRQPLPVRRIVAQATGMWLATRIIFLVITALAYAFDYSTFAPSDLSLFPANPELARYLLPLLASHPMLASWVHWDASWYLLISAHGYDIFTAGSSGFFPMYPLQIHLLTLLFGQQATLILALALSNLATLAAFIGLGLLAAHEAAGEDDADDASARLIKVTASYPFAFFLFAPYTEGFFLACVVFSFLCARRGWWGWATLCGALAGLTRPTAFALVPALAWEYGRQHGVWRRSWWRKGAWRSRRSLRTLAGGLAVVAAVPAGLGSYMLFLQLRYGDALTPFTAQIRFHGHDSWPVWQSLAALLQHMLAPRAWTMAAALLYLDGGLLILFLIITLLNMRRLPLLYTLYLLAMFFFLLSTPVPHRLEIIPSAGRYLLMATPIFLLISRWIRKRPGLETLIVAGGFMLQAVFALFFIGGMWIE